jgi:hypothetical protein
MIDWQNVIWIVVGAVLYAIGYKITEIIIDEIKEKKIRVRKKEKIDLSGTWYAVWQTTVEGKENINTEVLQIKQKGDKIIMENIEKSPENKLGGYKWKGVCKIYDNEHILGYYLPREPNVISKGVMYFLLNRVGNFMIGKWVGCNYDYEFTWGYGVIAKDRDFALEKIQKLLKLKTGLSNKKGGEL